MVKIRKYKEYDIKYEKKMFIAYKGKEKVFEDDKEEYLTNKIDRAEEELATVQRAKELKKAMTKIEGKEIVFEVMKFKRFFEGLNRFLCEGKLQFENGVMSLRGMDAANVAMVTRRLPYEGKFVKYFEVGVSVKDVAILCKKFKKALKEVRMSFEDRGLGEDTEKYINIGNGFGTVRFRCIDLEEREQKYPKLSPTARVVVPTVDFYKMLDFANVFIESLVFYINDARHVIVEGYDDVERGIRKDLGVALGGVGNEKAKYSVEYMKKKFFWTKEITVQFKKDYPLVINDGENELILAPRVEND